MSGNVIEDIKKRMAREPELAAGVKARLEEYDIARQVREARLKLGLTQAQVAAKADTAQTVIARIERGANLPKLELLTKIATALGCRLQVKLVKERVPA